MSPVYNPPGELGDVPPMPEKREAAAGAMQVGARIDHQHPRLTSAANVTLDPNGYATVTFTREFNQEPVLVFGALGSGTTPIPEFRGELVKTGDVWTGVRVYGQQSRALPSITAISTGLLGILQLINAINPVLALLSGFTPYEPAAGARVSVTAIQAS